MQICHNRQSKSPKSIRRPINHFCLFQRLVIVEPIKHRIIFFLIKFHLDGLKWFNIENIISIVKRGFLIVERRESHSFEMSTISLFATHHDPHSSPLSSVYRFDNFRDLIHKCDSSSNMVKSLHVPDLFPWHWHIFKELVDSMRNIFECTQIYSLILSEPFR